MDGEIGLLNQIHDRFETPLVWNRESSVDAKAKLRKPDNVGEIKVFERVVVGDVEEDRLDAARSWHTYRFPVARLLVRVRVDFFRAVVFERPIDSSLSE
jgi:hypothetical protein